MEIKWEKTTFGELKAGDVFRVDEPEKGENILPYVGVCVREHGDYNHQMEPPSTPVFRLVTPEREALKKIVALQIDNDNDDEFDMANKWLEAHSIATAALSLLEKGGEG